MFMFEAVVLKGVRECQPSEVIENMAAVGLASSAAEPIRRRPGYFKPRVGTYHRAQQASHHC